MSKIRLSPEEWELVKDPGLLIRKNVILHKAELLLGQVATAGHPYLQAQFPEEASSLLLSMPKLSKGEQYKGLPYRILDFPRIFSKDDVFACRTLFWWGNPFTFMVHLKGTYLRQYADHFVEAIYHTPSRDWHIGISGDEWEHDAFRYPLLKSWSLEDWKERISQAPFVKLFYPIPLKDWEGIPEEVQVLYKLLVGAVCKAHQFPKR